MEHVDHVTITAKPAQEISLPAQAVILLHLFPIFTILFVYLLAHNCTTIILDQEFAVYVVQYLQFTVKIVLRNQLVSVVMLDMFY